MIKRQDNEPQLRPHVFDGIVELDNDLPRWWVLLFVVSIIFSVGYLAWYTLPIFHATTLTGEYDEAVRASKARTAAAPTQMAAGAAAPAAAFDYDAAAKKPAVLEAGKATFVAYCVACHGVNAQGVVGPNLTDDFWIHGSTLAQVEHTVTMGELQKGMPPWGEALGAEKIHEVVAYVRSLKHSRPANPKPPQGEPGVLP